MNECVTLGGKSKFWYLYENEVLYIMFGQMVKPIIVRKEWIIVGRNRVKDTNRSTITSDYNKPKWAECPNDRTCPYVAALVIKGLI